MTRNEDATCSNCPCWTIEHEHNGTSWGFCHRFPPRLEPGEHRFVTRWPESVGIQWCAEHPDFDSEGQA